MPLQKCFMAIKMLLIRLFLFLSNPLRQPLPERTSFWENTNVIIDSYKYACIYPFPLFKHETNETWLTEFFSPLQLQYSTP